MRPTSAITLLVTLAACGSPSPTTDDTDSDPDTAGDTETSDLEAFRVHGYLFKIAWDDKAAATRSYTLDGVESPSTVQLILGTADFRSRADTDTYCSLTYDIDGLSEAAFSDTEGWDIGLSMTLSADKLVSDDCTARVGTVFSPASFEDAPTTDVSDWTIDLGIGKTPDDSLTGDDLDQALGGAIHLTYDPPDDTDEPREGSPVATYGYAVDETFVVTLDDADDKTRLAPADLPTKNGIANGFYEIDAVYLWFFDSSL